MTGAALEMMVLLIAINQKFGSRRCMTVSHPAGLEDATSSPRYFVLADS